MATQVERRVSYFSASAQCEVTFIDGPITDSFTVPFYRAARACADYQLFDPDRERQVLRLESLVTLFHSDDRRPGWMKRVMALRGLQSEKLPRPISRLAAKWLEDYGPGSITVIQDEHRPVAGEVIAGAPGRDGEFFPAYSYFDQYLVVKVMGRTFTNKDPLRVSSLVRQWPPQGEVYRSEAVTDFFDAADLDGRPVFQFGKCTVAIKDPLTDEEIQGLRDFVESLRAA